MVYIIDQKIIVELNYWDAVDYMQALSALVYCAKNLDTQLFDANVISSLCFLLEEMLPAPNQVDLTKLPEH